MRRARLGPDGGSVRALGFMGKPAVIVSVEKQPNVDTIGLTREIERALKEITASLPQGMKADQIVFRQADFIEHAVGNVAHSLWIGAALVAVVLLLFVTVKVAAELGELTTTFP